MMIIGIGGYIGSGKTYLCDKFISKIKDAFIIHADDLTRKCLIDKRVQEYIMKNAPNAISRFGVNRKIIIQEIFSDFIKGEEYSTIAWKVISELIDEIILKRKKIAKYIFIEAALINRLEIKFDKVIWVETANNLVYIDRLIEKGNKGDIENILRMLEFQKNEVYNFYEKYNYFIDSTSDNTLLTGLSLFLDDLGIDNSILN